MGSRCSVNPFDREFFLGGDMVDFDVRKGIVMHAHYIFTLEKTSGADGLIDIHRQSAA